VTMMSVPAGATDPAGIGFERIRNSTSVSNVMPTYN
jgi:hypothetical protein